MTPGDSLTFKTDLRAHQCDLRDRASVADLVTTCRPEITYHLAAHGAYPSQTDVRSILETNVSGTWNLLEALKVRGCELVVNAGTSSEYGFRNRAMKESDPLAPISAYAVAKSAQTLLCRQVSEANLLPIVTLRLFSAYGPFEDRNRLIPTLIRRCLAGDELMLADPDSAHDFVYIDDIVDAFVHTASLAHQARRGVQFGHRQANDTAANRHCSDGGDFEAGAVSLERNPFSPLGLPDVEGGLHQEPESTRLESDHISRNRAATLSSMDAGSPCPHTSRLVRSSDTSTVEGRGGRWTI